MMILIKKYNYYLIAYFIISRSKSSKVHAALVKLKILTVNTMTNVAIIRKDVCSGCN